MKQIRVFLLTSIITLSAFAAVIYSSCKKDPCKGVTCQNGGACNNGSCVCPSGYSGNFCENSTITYTNDTYTPISINVGGSTAIINPSSSVSFSGGAGTAVNVSASTAGTTTSGTQVGDLISWSFTDNFPTGGDQLTEPLDVSADYFYLYVINKLTSNINSIVVNSQSTNYISVPNDWNTYATGYFLAGSGYVTLYVTTTAGDNISYSGIGVPNTANASVTFTAY